MNLPPLAFVDVETTGVDPRENRITEIGVVTVDGDDVREWATVVDPLTRRREGTVPPAGITDDMRSLAPRFRDVGADLARRLAGRLFIAHNARFDYAFLKAEFNRIGIDFRPAVLCSLMLSRKLYSELPHHDLDSLIVLSRAGSRGKAPGVARRETDLAILAGCPSRLRGTAVAEAIDALRAGPLLPAHLHPSLIDRLPEAPGIYVFHGDDDEVLMSGAAGNLKSRVLNYFRQDLMSGRALAISHRIRNITWRVTRGTLGAKLQLAQLPGTSLPATRRPKSAALCSWRFAPGGRPCLSLVSLADRSLSAADEWFGMFDSPRKARNALHRLAANHALCHSLLGIGEPPAADCRACPPAAGPACDGSAARLVHLTRAFTALRDLRVPVWPYRGPIGIRERSELYIVDRWQFLGTARNDAEIHAALETRDPAFDVRMFRLLAKTLPKLPENRIVCLASNAKAAEPKRVFPACAVPSSS